MSAHEHLIRRQRRLLSTFVFDGNGTLIIICKKKKKGQIQIKSDLSFSVQKVTKTKSPKRPDIIYHKVDPI